jgi:GT2 family glycosyltransferase
MTPRTALIILNWNSREMTAECIRSVLSMHGNDYELIVVDNGSHDSSVEYLKREFPQSTLLPQSRNLGFAAGCNIAIREALGRGVKYVLPLNNDTIVDRDFLNELVRVAERNPQAGIVSPKIYYYDSPERLWWAGGRFSLWTGIPTHVGRKERELGQFNRERRLDWATGCALLMRCDVLREIGLFDERVCGNGEDLDLSLRVRRAGFDIWYAPKARVWHKEGVDFRKNRGEHARKFTATRSLLWIMHRYAKPIQWVSFLPNFAVRYILFYALLSIWRGDFRSVYALFQGIAEFRRMRARPSPTLLPAPVTVSRNPKEYLPKPANR